MPHPRSQETPKGLAVDHLDDDWTLVTVQGWDFEVLVSVDPLGNVQVWAYDPRDPDTCAPVPLASVDVYSALRHAVAGTRSASPPAR